MKRYCKDVYKMYQINNQEKNTSKSQNISRFKSNK